MEKQMDVYGIGNAIVDTCVFVPDDFIREHNLNRGTMTLVDSEKQGALLLALQNEPMELKSGGSAANTMFALSRLGGKGFYTGKISKDTFGEFYRQDLLKAGIHFDVHPGSEKEGPTGSCLIMVTPDAERTMYTHLGISSSLSPVDINREKLLSCKITYIEGYLWYSEASREAALTAMRHAKAADVKVAFSFSDPSCVSLFREDFLMLVRDYCDIIFCNADEAKEFSEMSDLDNAAAYIGNLCELVFITDGPRGSLVVRNHKVYRVDGFPVKPLDTNGAGDAFAGGALYGLTHSHTAEESARLGNYLASRVVMQLGPRVEESFHGKAAAILSE